MYKKRKTPTPDFCFGCRKKNKKETLQINNCNRGSTAHNCPHVHRYISDVAFSVLFDKMHFKVKETFSKSFLLEHSAQDEETLFAALKKEIRIFLSCDGRVCKVLYAVFSVGNIVPVLTLLAGLLTFT